MAVLKRLDSVFVLVLVVTALFALAQGGKTGIMKMRGLGVKYELISGEMMTVKRVSENKRGQPCTEYVCGKEASNEDVPCWCCGPPLAFGTCSFNKTLCLICNAN